MHRLFIAMRPPQSVRAQLLGIMGGVEGARWQEDDQLHLTLRYIGEVDRRTAEDIAASLGSLHHAPVEIALRGVGHFTRRGITDVLWVGVTSHEVVRLLHKKVDHALVRVGLPPESRAYLPHITIARFGKRVGDVGGFIAAHGGLTSVPFAMDWLGLFESHIGHSGSRYELVERYVLS